MMELKATLLLVCLSLLSNVSGQYRPGQTDRGKGTFLGHFETLEHLVAGAVWALDDEWLHVENFTYDGRGPDAFFWVGTEGDQPSPAGHIVPSVSSGRGDGEVVLSAYHGENLLFRLPSDLKVSNLRWISIWCRRFTVDFGNLRVPRNLELPKKRKLSGLSRLAHNVRSGNVTLLDTKTLYIPNLHYDGSAPDAYFWVGTGGTPNNHGRKIPNEKKSTAKLGHYDGVDIELVLPDNMTLYDIDYLAIWCVAYRHNFGHVLIPKPNDMYLPPALGQTQKDGPVAVDGSDRDRYNTADEVYNTTPLYHLYDSTTTHTDDSLSSDTHVQHTTIQPDTHFDNYDMLNEDMTDKETSIDGVTDNETTSIDDVTDSVTVMGDMTHIDTTIDDMTHIDTTIDDMTHNETAIDDTYAEIDTSGLAIPENQNDTATEMSLLDHNEDVHMVNSMEGEMNKEVGSEMKHLMPDFMETVTSISVHFENESTSESHIDFEKSEEARHGLMGIGDESEILEDNLYLGAPISENNYTFRYGKAETQDPTYVFETSNSNVNEENNMYLNDFGGPRNQTLSSNEYTFIPDPDPEIKPISDTDGSEITEILIHNNKKNFTYAVGNNQAIQHLVDGINSGSDYNPYGLIKIDVQRHSGAHFFASSDNENEENSFTDDPTTLEEETRYSVSSSVSSSDDHEYHNHGLEEDHHPQEPYRHHPKDVYTVQVAVNYTESQLNVVNDHDEHMNAEVVEETYIDEIHHPHMETMDENHQHHMETMDKEHHHTETVMNENEEDHIKTLDEEHLDVVDNHIQEKLKVSASSSEAKVPGGVYTALLFVVGLIMFMWKI